MRGAAAAFALTTPFESGAGAEVLQGQAVIDAAAAARLPHLVFSSVAGATAGTGIPHFESKAAVEQALAASGIPHTVVAPTYFYDNALGGQEDLLAGTLELPLPADHRLQQLDRSDLGSFVKFILRDPRSFAGRRIELASDEPTPDQMSRALSEALARQIRFRETPMAEVRRGNPDIAAMWGFLRGTGYQADIAALRRTYPAVTRTSFADWAKRAFRSKGS
jgi:uncharacterized protein YbjT (DUF2867 family)